MTKILHSAYLPSISYIGHIAEAPLDCTIDLGEHFVKRSSRNRTRIMTAQGVMELTVPVRRANSPRQPIAAVEIDNSKRWQHQHWIAMLSAYKASPFFDHYAPYLEPLYQRRFELLSEFNQELLNTLLRLLRIEGRPQLSHTYIEPTSSPSLIDLRGRGAVDEGFEPTPYIQVFEDRVPFVGNLSIVDLLFCEGTNASDYVGASRR